MVDKAQLIYKVSQLIAGITNTLLPETFRKRITVSEWGKKDGFERRKLVSKQT